jgi:hypothetical protein
MNKTSNLEQNPPLQQTAVKCRFFAQYWGTKTLYVGGVGLVEIGTGGWNLKHPDFFLELKRLSAISNEDAIEVAKLNKSINWNNDKTPEVWLNSFQDTVVSNGRGLIDKYGQTIVTNLDYLNFEQVDLLRSKGYCLPFMGLSVLKLVELGWVRLV